MASIGIRVIRGPDWDASNADGGEGHLGTLTELLSNHRVRVVWDTGQEGTHRAGEAGKFDLRIFDTAQAGVRHPDTRCAECGEVHIYGTLWRCKECTGCVLCSACYSDDKHNIRHQFLRLDTFNSAGVEVKKRKISVKMRALGLFPGAKVKRGRDWQWGDQDGGIGSEGELLTFENVSPTSSRNLVKVKWLNGVTNSYRLGFQGQVDLSCVDEEAGQFYYRDHLPVLDSSQLPFPLAPPEAFKATTSPPPSTTTSDTGISTSSPATSSSSGTTHTVTSSSDGSGAQAAGGYTTPGEATVASGQDELSLAVGDKVAIAVDENKLRDLQDDFGGCSDTMVKMIGETGEVMEIKPDGKVMVRLKTKKFGFNPATLVKVVTSLKHGDTVRIRYNVEQVKVLMKNHGWSPDMVAACGKVGRVTQIEDTDTVTVSFGSDTFRYTVACCVPAPGAATDTLVATPAQDDPAAYWNQENNNTQSSTVEDASDLGKALLRALLGTKGSGSGGENSDPKVRELFNAIQNNDITKVVSLVTSNKDMLKAIHKGKTPLMYASQRGRREIVTLLLDLGADINFQGEKGRTALLLAIDGEHEDTALLLLERGANPRAKNHRQRTPLHAAAYENMAQVVQILICMDVDVNAKDSVQDTPLFDAIEKGNEAVVEVLLQAPTLNRYELNAKGFNMLQLAALKGKARTVELILTSEEYPHVDDLLLGEYSALHIAANNDHEEAIGYLVLLGGATLDIPDGRRHLTPLHLACKRRQIKAAEALIGLGAQVNVFDVNGNSPLHIAMGKRLEDDNDDSDVSHSKVVEHRVQLACMLIRKGVFVDAQDDTGKTALEYGPQEVQDQVKKFIQDNAHLVKRFDDADVQTLETSAQTQTEISCAYDTATDASVSATDATSEQDVTSKQDAAVMSVMLQGVSLQCKDCDAMSDVTLQPCGHKTVCHNCCDNITRCPICDVVIENREFEMKDEGEGTENENKFE